MTKTTAILPPPHPAMLPEETLLKQCTTEFGRMAGPGGQHRNKTETGVQLYDLHWRHGSGFESVRCAWPPCSL